MKAPASILVIRRDNIGDLVCTTPLITALRKSFPGARMEVLANSYNAPVLEGNPDIDRVHVYTKLKHVAISNEVIPALSARVSTLWKLRSARIELAVIAAGAQDPRSFRLAKLIAARNVVSAEDPVRGQHEVERTFTAARRLGIDCQIPSLRLVSSPALSGAVSERLRLGDFLKGQVLVGMHISARRRTQRWQAQKFAELSIALHQTCNASTMLLWSPGSEHHPQHPGDDEKAAKVLELISGRSPVVPCPTVELRQLIGALSLCDVVICSDGGAMHVAAGLGKRIACFFGDSEIQRWKPWGVSHVVMHGENDNVENIPVRVAQDAAIALMNR